jgi:hypothetical protein
MLFRPVLRVGEGWIRNLVGVSMLSMVTDGCSRCAAILLESDGGLHWHGNWPARLSSGDGRRGIHPLGCRHGQRGRKVASLQHSAFSIQHPLFCAARPSRSLTN